MNLYGTAYNTSLMGKKNWDREALELRRERAIASGAHCIARKNKS